MLFKKKKKIEEPKPLEVIEEPKEEPVIPENENDKADFMTTDNKLAFSLQDKFMVKSMFYDKKNNGIKTYVFNASNKDIGTFLKEGK